MGTLGHTYLLYENGGRGSTWAISRKNPLLAFWFFHYFIYFIYSILLGAQHWHLISKNLTTNEMINSWKYPYFKDSTGTFKNPFDKGKFHNFVDFFSGSEKIVLPAKEVFEDDGTIEV